MANICINMFLCETMNEENFNTISDFVTKTFSWDYCDINDHNIEGEFSSRWSFPESDFNELTSKLSKDETLYMRILSYEFGEEYVSFKIYKNNKWHIIA